MQLGMIYARARNGVIGRQGHLPWHLPEDLAHFKTLTQGCPVIMGRKTWDSLPPRFRPLPGRRNIVVTGQPGWHTEGAEPVRSLDEAIALCAQAPRAWVIGGAQLYALAEPRCQVAEVTLIEQDFEGDVYAPELGPGWTEAGRRPGTSGSALAHCFIRYERAVGPG